MLQFTFSNLHLAMNYQLSFTNRKQSNAQHSPSLEIENCELKIATQKGVA